MASSFIGLYSVEENLTTVFIVAGTPATASQMAKDVVTFLSWAAEPEHDERKKMGLKAMIIMSSLFLISIYVKRFKWSSIKNRKIGTFSFFSFSQSIGNALLTSLPHLDSLHTTKGSKLTLIKA